MAVFISTLKTQNIICIIAPYPQGTILFDCIGSMKTCGYRIDIIKDFRGCHIRRGCPIEGAATVSQFTATISTERPQGMTSIDVRMGSTCAD